MDALISFMYPSLLDPQKSSTLLLWETHHSPEDAPSWPLYKLYVSLEIHQLVLCLAFKEWVLALQQRQGGNMLGKNEKTRIRVPALPFNRCVVLDSTCQQSWASPHLSARELAKVTSRVFLTLNALLFIPCFIKSISLLQHHQVSRTLKCIWELKGTDRHQLSCTNSISFS